MIRDYYETLLGKRFDFITFNCRSDGILAPSSSIKDESSLSNEWIAEILLGGAGISLGLPKWVPFLSGSWLRINRPARVPRDSWLRGIKGGRRSVLWYCFLQFATTPNRVVSHRILRESCFVTFVLDLTPVNHPRFIPVYYNFSKHKIIGNEVTLN